VSSVFRIGNRAAVLDAGLDHLRETGLHFGRRGIRGDVPVLRRLATQQVAHTTADDPATLATFAQALQDEVDVVRHLVEGGMHAGGSPAQGEVRKLEHDARREQQAPDSGGEWPRVRSGRRQRKRPA